MGKLVTRLVMMVAGGKAWGNGENKESEETPNTTRQLVRRLGSTGILYPALSSVDRGGQCWEWGGGGRERKGGCGGNKDSSVSLPGT